MLVNTEGSYNTAVGRLSLNVNTSGGNNTAIGESALADNTTGGTNTAIGSAALTNNTTGANNVAVGRIALSTNATGSANTALGTESDVASYGLGNDTAIGYGAIVPASNAMSFGTERSEEQTSTSSHYFAPSMTSPARQKK